MKKPYYIDYPQEHVEGHAYTYQCAFCKIITTKINGNLEGHLNDCEYRLGLERRGFEKNQNSSAVNSVVSDETD